MLARMMNSMKDMLTKCWSCNHGKPGSNDGAAWAMRDESLDAGQFANALRNGDQHNQDRRTDWQCR